MVNASLSLAARLQAQTKPLPAHRVVLSQGHGFLIELNGTLQTWVSAPAANDGDPAPFVLGLGHNGPVFVHTLYPVPGVTNVVSAVAGAAASFAVLTDGRVLSWGSMGRGILGTTPRPEFEERAQPRARTNTPTPVAVRFDAVAVSCIGDHVLALARDGSVYAWGYGTSGQLGIGPLPVVNFRTRSPSAMPEVPYPVRIPDLGDVIAVKAGARHSLALRKDGTVFAWGDNTLGQVGDGTTINRDRPVVVQGVRSAVAIAAGASFSVVVLSDGTVMEWGATYTNPQPRPRPALLAGIRGARSVVAGDGHGAVITQAGGVITWGQNSHYETGRGRNASLTPAPVAGLTDVRYLAACTSQTIAVLGSGRMMTWGEVRGWTRPDTGGAGLSPFPILLWLDGLEQS
jgi:alpha-tubulin suppressor-like RCC1 family protein